MKKKISEWTNFLLFLDLFHVPGLNSRDLPLKATNLKDKPNQELLNTIIRKFTLPELLTAVQAVRIK